MLKGTDKSDVRRRQKCSLAATKVKTAPTDDKTASMNNKTVPTDDKTKPMFGSSFSFYLTNDMPRRVVQSLGFWCRETAAVKTDRCLF